MIYHGATDGVTKPNGESSMRTLVSRRVQALTCDGCGGSPCRCHGARMPSRGVLQRARGTPLQVRTVYEGARVETVSAHQCCAAEDEVL